jgi:hypothetical protein
VVLHIAASDVQTWLESTKLPIASVDPNLETDVAAEVLGRLSSTYSKYVPTWTDSTNTPQVVKQVIAMYYAGWMYDRAFSEVETGEGNSSYGALLRRWASNLLQDIIRGAVSIVEIQPNVPAVAPISYPTDVSSTWEAWQANTDCNDKSLGPAKFGMDMRF